MIHYDAELGLSDLAVVVGNAVYDLQPYAAEFDSIAVEGVSGIIIGSPVSLVLAKPLIIVRKDADVANAHCPHVSAVENAAAAGNRVLFLDDYVGEGKTLRHVATQIQTLTSGHITARYETYYRKYTTGDATFRTPFNKTIDELLEELAVSPFS